MPISFRKLIPLTLISLGLILLFNVAVPIGFSHLNFSFSLSPRLIDPTAVAAVPAPLIGSLTTTDYSQPTTWFSGDLPAPPALVSKVNYYTLHFPRLRIESVVEIGGEDLKKNPIQFAGTALPGSFGNTVIFGHSTLPQFFKPGNSISIFNHLPEAKVGDEVTVSYDGITYRYVVRNISVVSPTQIEILAQRYDKHELTLVTCVPLGTYLKRFVVRAELVN